MDQLLHAVAGYACLLKHLADPGEVRLGVIAAGRQDFAGGGAPVLGDENEVGKGAADVDAEAANRISGHCLSTPRCRYPPPAAPAHRAASILPQGSKAIPAIPCGTRMTKT